MKALPSLMRRCMRLFVLLILGSMYLSHPRVTYACSCVMPPDAREAMRSATTVFAGKVTSIELLDTPQPVRHQFEFNTTFPFFHVVEVIWPWGNVVTFEVSRVWKGSTNETAVVSTGMGGGDCGYIFNKQQEYIVYTNGNVGQLS